MIRCVRIWTGADGDTRFEEGAIEMAAGARGDLPSGKPDDAEACLRSRAETARVLKVENV